MLCSDCDLGYEKLPSVTYASVRVLKFCNYTHHHSCRVNSLTQWHCTLGPLWECKKTARHSARVKAACHVFNFAPNYTACGRCIHSESSSLRAKFPSLERAPQECGLGRRSWTSGGWMLPWVATGLPRQLTFASSL
jgi:hypothetical protein